MSRPIEVRWAKVPGRAAKDRALKERTLRVLIAICSYINAHDGAWPSIDAIAADTDLDRRNVSHEIARLVKAGYLERDGWHVHRFGRNRQYRIILTSEVRVSQDANQYASHETLTDGTEQGRCASLETRKQTKYNKPN
jgi:DNA-binding transcriptional ArsR family regulator